MKYSLFDWMSFVSMLRSVFSVLVFALLFCRGPIAWAAVGLSLESLRSSVLFEHVRSIKAAQHSDHLSLVNKLVAPAKNDTEKAWLVYRWVTHNFRHDNRLAVRVGKPEQHALNDLIRLAGGSCEVYAHVTSELLRAAGLETKVVKGRAKSGFAPVGAQGINHVWNLVNVDGQWWVMDPTWGAGYVASGRFHREPSDLFFLMSPELSTLSHYDPQDTLGAQLAQQLTSRQFSGLPDGAIYLAALGISPADIHAQFKMDSRAGLVETFNQAAGDLRLRKVPISRRLPKTPQVFQIESSAFEELVLVQGRRWVPMSKTGRLYHIEFKPASGELLVMGRRPKQSEFEAILAYEVR
ncbi:MAG TPA: transglutaminase domain-containing protein [Limnobacter sp.]|nr:transglutaminase domain-containing protein [Limnobacter sp.]